MHPVTESVSSYSGIKTVLFASSVISIFHVYGCQAFNILLWMQPTSHPLFSSVPFYSLTASCPPEASVFHSDTEPPAF